MDQSGAYQLYEIEISSRKPKIKTVSRSPIQFALATSGEINFHIQGKKQSLSAGQVLFINSGAEYSAEAANASGNAAYAVLEYYPIDLFNPADLGMRSRYVDSIIHAAGLTSMVFKSEHSEIPKFYEEIMKLHYLSPDDKLTMRILLLQLWQALYTEVQPYIAGTVRVSISDSERANIMKQFISDNLSEKITLDDMAKAAHISRSECCRIFRRIYQVSPTRYLTRMRLTQSMKLLGETDLTISDIALQTGFGSSSYFSECFKKETDYTPLKYRHSCQTRAD